MAELAGYFERVGAPSDSAYSRSCQTTNPDAARAVAGSTRSAQGRDPKRRQASYRPATVPGTPAARAP
jgi:hypothetical protein